MYKEMYIALSGAVLKQKNMDIFAQNISNSNTTGFKKDRLSFKDYIVPSDNTSGTAAAGISMTQLSEQVTDFSQGHAFVTDNPLDLAINGDGFFALENNRYTRNGNFMINSDGYLATNDNINVLGDGGPIAVEGSIIEISNSGEVFSDGISVASIKVVDFEDRSTLKKVDGGYFYTEETGEDLDADISQGYLESSNVEIVREMVKMVSFLREFESYQKMIHSLDEATSRTINEMGR